MIKDIAAGMAGIFLASIQGVFLYIAFAFDRPLDRLERYADRQLARRR